MKPHIDAVAVVAKDLKKTLEFYTLLGFDLKQVMAGSDHYEAVQDNGLRLMIDTDELLKSLGQPTATPASFANFALKWDSPGECDAVATKVREAGFEIVMEPQDMFWGQRYATIKDPNGNRIDMFAWLGKQP
jgi:uncharacterized glyoxalase superfamily protein PhnB